MGHRNQPQRDTPSGLVGALGFSFGFGQGFGEALLGRADRAHGAAVLRVAMSAVGLGALMAPVWRGVFLMLRAPRLASLCFAVLSVIFWLGWVIGGAAWVLIELGFAYVAVVSKTGLGLLGSLGFRSGWIQQSSTNRLC